MSRLLPRLWSAVERFAHARGALPATLLWNLGQGSVVPGPAELLLVPLAIADPPRRWPLVMAATTGAAIGGCISYWIGASAFETLGRPLLAFLGIGNETVRRVLDLMQRYGWLFIVVSTLTPISTKVVCLAAGSAGMPFPLFALALTIGRGLRFSADVLLLRVGAGALQRLRARVFRDG